MEDTCPTSVAKLNEDRLPSSDRLRTNGQVVVSPVPSEPTSMSPIDPRDPALHRTFRENGFVILKGMIDKRLLETHHMNILGAYDRARGKGGLFAGGGTISGHLNCFPGAESKFVYDTLVERGVIDLVKALSPQAVRLPNVGCNLNLPGSHPQNEHADGYAAAPFAIVNIASVDTDSSNGAMEVMPGTHRREYRYWQIVLDRPSRLRPALERGDVLVRSSLLWHRGMPNNSRTPRPMLALTWEDGGSNQSDPYALHEGRISFFPNRYQPTTIGRLKERAFVAAPRVNSAVRFVRSLF